MSQITNKLSVSLRLIGVSHEAAEHCRSFFDLGDVRFRENKKLGGLVVALPVSSSEDASRIVSYLSSNEINLKKRDLFVSILTEYDSWIYDLPSFALDILHDLHCPVTISFTCV
mgnify:CR=1 FL=1